MIANNIKESVRSIIKERAGNANEVIDMVKDTSNVADFPTWVAAALEASLKDNSTLAISIINHLHIDTIREVTVVAGFHSEVTACIAQFLWREDRLGKLLDAKWIVENGYEDILFTFPKSWKYYISEGVSSAAVKIGDPELLRSLIVHYGFTVVINIAKESIVTQAMDLLTESEMENFIEDAFDAYVSYNNLDSLFATFGKEVTIGEVISRGLKVNVAQVEDLVEENDDEDIWKLIPPLSWAYILVPKFTEDGIEDFINANPLEIKNLGKEHVTPRIFNFIIDTYGVEGLNKIDEDVLSKAVTEDMWDTCVHGGRISILDAIGYIPNALRIKHADWMIEAIEYIEINTI